MTKKYVVYTALFGGYDVLPDITSNKSSLIDYVCFTDSDLCDAKGWNVVKVDWGSEQLTPAMMNRYFKLHPHVELSGYTFSLYVDANIKINSNLLSFFKKYEADNNFCMPKHSERDCVYKEAKECIIQRKENEEIILQQMRAYKREGMPEHYGLGENNILFRVHNNEFVIKLMTDWWAELQTKSKRDQLSLAYVLWKNGMKFSFLEETCRNINPYFAFQPHKSHLERNFHKKLIDKLNIYFRRIRYAHWCP